MWPTTPQATARRSTPGHPATPATPIPRTRCGRETAMTKPKATHCIPLCLLRRTSRGTFRAAARLCRPWRTSASAPPAQVRVCREFCFLSPNLPWVTCTLLSLRSHWCWHARFHLHLQRPGLPDVDHQQNGRYHPQWGQPVALPRWR